MNQDGSGGFQQITQNVDTYKYKIQWSPDGKKILWSDRKLRLSYVDVATKAVVQVAQAERWEMRQYSWLPDSRWIAYTRAEIETKCRKSIFILSTPKKV